MRRLAVIAALLACSLVVSAVALAGKPRLEQKRLRPADMTLAKATALRVSDLSRGWVRRPAQKPSNELPTCPGVDMDFSMFTITGTASSRFEQQSATIDSHVEVFRSSSDAVRDFRKATTAPVLRCIGRWLREEAKREIPGARVASSKLISRPRIGQQAVHYRIVLEIQAAGGTVPVYVDLLGFQRGRTGVSLTFGNIGSPLRGELAVARSIAARTR